MQAQGGAGANAGMAAYVWRMLGVWEDRHRRECGWSCIQARVGLEERDQCTRGSIKVNGCACSGRYSWIEIRPAVPLHLAVVTALPPSHPKKTFIFVCSWSYGGPQLVNCPYGWPLWPQTVSQFFKSYLQTYFGLS